MDQVHPVHIHGVCMCALTSVGVALFASFRSNQRKQHDVRRTKLTSRSLRPGRFRTIGPVGLDMNRPPCVQPWPACSDGFEGCLLRAQPWQELRLRLTRK